MRRSCPYCVRLRTRDVYATAKNREPTGFLRLHGKSTRTHPGLFLILAKLESMARLGCFGIGG